MNCPGGKGGFSGVKGAQCAQGSGVKMFVQRINEDNYIVSKDKGEVPRM